LLPVDSRALEELTLNAWPPLDSLLFDGWLLGFSDGYTRRANSIQPLYPSRLPLADKIAICEGTYAARGQESIFKLTDATDPPELDATLEGSGYDLAATTSVQVAELVGSSAVVGAAASVDDSVVLSARLEDAWLADFNRLSVTPERFAPTMASMLRKIVLPHAFASISLDGQAVALGLAVAERGYVGLFDIIVDSNVRNQGLGRRLCTRLLQWARAEHDAGQAYLAVMVDNAPAVHLYQSLGFREAYRYWYRHRRM
jgi:ribosomal protein S18 acetylase RimI-like enzyme